MNSWARVLKAVETRINRGSFQNWFKPTKYLESVDGTIVVQVPNALFRDWLTRNYSELIAQASRDCGLEESPVRYVVAGTEFTNELAAVEEPDRAREQIRESRPSQQPLRSSDLNSKYRFETFVVGSCNQFAHAAALAVAENTASTYNPLFIYGGVGLGKTHLMHAIGQQIKKVRSNAVLAYTSSETFMNELVNAIRFDGTNEFRAKYRHVDILLIDDIQFLAGKERTQEEFFHTFNALYEAEKKIVISSDRTPKEIPTLEERLQSRFEWGLIADIQPPDLETKIAILKRKADAENIVMDDDVAMYIAGQVKSNIRELEGCLIRLVAFASMNDQYLDLDLAKQALAGVLSRGVGQVELTRIIQTVAEHYGLKPQQLISRSNAHAIAHPRQIAMFLAKKLTKASFPQIGKAFGGKHHTTVMHSVNKVEDRIEREPDYRRTVHSLTEALR